MPLQLHHYNMDRISQVPQTSSILSNSRIPLFQLQKLNLFFPTHIFWKVSLQKFSLENNPSDFIAYNLQSLTHIVPPIINFLYQCMHTKLHLLCFSTRHNLENIFNILQLSSCSIQIIPTFEGRWVIPLELFQVAKLIIPSILVVLHSLNHCLQRGNNNSIISPNHILNNINK